MMSSYVGQGRLTHLGCHFTARGLVPYQKHFSTRTTAYLLDDLQVVYALETVSLQ